MSESVEETFEDRKKCPKCTLPGEDVSSVAAPNLPRGTKIHTIYCRNAKCKWFNTPWMVQINPDGSVPASKDHTKTPKHYVGFEGHDAMAQQLILALEADRRLSESRNGEITRRLGR